LLKYSQNTAGDYFYLPHPVDICAVIMTFHSRLSHESCCVL